MSKPMERIVYNVMYNFFKSLGLLNARNSGFKEKDSTINQLIHLCNNIYKGLDETKDVCLVFQARPQLKELRYANPLGDRGSQLGFHLLSRYWPYLPQ